MAFYPTYLRTAAIALLFLSACAKDDDPAPAPASTSRLTWTVDGGALTAEATAGLSPGGLLFIRGQHATSTLTKGIELVLPAQVGTFAAPGPDRARALYRTYEYQSNTTVATEYPSTAGGTITVSSYTASPELGGSVIVGTFAFLGNDTDPYGGIGTRNITQGSFNIRF